MQHIQAYFCTLISLALKKTQYLNWTSYERITHYNRSFISVLIYLSYNGYWNWAFLSASKLKTLFLAEKFLPCIFFKYLRGNWLLFKAQTSLWTSCGFKVKSKLNGFQWIMMMRPQGSNTSHHHVLDCCCY